MPDLPRSRELVLHSGVLRLLPEDFRVDEDLGFQLDGAGEHLWVRVRKTSANTAWVARKLSEITGVRQKDIGFAGLKDRHAVTTQWFSLPDTGHTLELTVGELVPDVEILELVRHGRKLRRGALRGNYFQIRVREARGDIESVASAVSEIRTRGVPNYFGEQRFGRAGNNVVQARKMFQGQYRPGNRNEKSLLISAARSEIFNSVLAERVGRANWNRALNGEVLQLAGSNSVFTVDVIDEEIISRTAQFDIHPTGPLWGRGRLMSSGEVAKLETSVADSEPVLRNGLEHAGLKQERRPLRLPVPDLEAEQENDETWVFSFFLPAGSYATSVMRELVDYKVAQGTV